MAEEYQRSNNVFDDLDDLLNEVADAHLPGYQGHKPTQVLDDTDGLTAAQKKRRKRKNKKKQQ